MSSWSEVEELFIVILEFESKKVVDILQAGQSFDTVQVIVYDAMAKQDVTHLLWE